MDHCRDAVDRQLLAPLLTVFRNFDQEQGTEYLPQDLACNVQIQRQTNGDMGARTRRDPCAGVRRSGANACRVAPHTPDQPGVNRTAPNE